MPTQTVASIQTGLKAKKFAAAYLLSGEELKLIENMANSIESALDVDPIGKEVFFGSDLKAGDLIMSAETLPFMTGSRYIVIKDANKIKAAEAKILAAFINNGLPQTSHLVFIWPEKLSKKRNDLTEALGKAADCLEFRRLYDNEVPAWIQQQCKAAGKTIDLAGTQYLADQAGGSLLDLSNEIEKLIIYCGPSKDITAADVKASVGNVKQYDLNDLGNAVERRELPKAVAICEGLSCDGEAGLRILAAIGRTLRKLALAKSMREEENISVADIKLQLRLHPFFAKDFFTNLQKFTLAELSASLSKIQRADLALKSSGRPEVAILQGLLISVLSPSTSPLQAR